MNIEVIENHYSVFIIRYSLKEAPQYFMFFYVLNSFGQNPPCFGQF
jgi:hypothetical protein